MNFLKNSRSPTSISIVVYGLIVLNIVIYLYEVSLNGSALQQFLESWAIIPKQLTLELAGERLTAAYEWPTLLTFQFLHADWLHLAGNLLCLWIFGRKIEAIWGHAAFLSFYLICGGLAGLAQWMAVPSSLLPILGASGAIAGTMGAYLVCSPQARIALFFVGFWFAQQLFYGALSWEHSGLGDMGLGNAVEMMPVNVAYAAHAGGFVVGVVFSWLASLLSNSRRRYSR